MRPRGYLLEGSLGREQAEQLERTGDLGKVAEIRYGKITEAEAELENLKAQMEEMKAKNKELKKAGASARVT